MDGFNANLFNSDDGVRNLLRGGELFGIFLGDESGHTVKNNIVDLGMIERESLDCVTQPFIFDSYMDSNVKRVIQVASTLECIDMSKALKQKTKSSLPPQYTLTKCEYFPKTAATNAIDPTYNIQFESMNKGVTTVCLSPGAVERFIVNISIDEKFEGSIGKWVILTFKTFDTPAPTVFTETVFVMGILIKGSVISFASRNKLTVDAPTFIPTYLSSFFDSLCPVFNTLQLPEPKRKMHAFPPPPIFQAVIDRMRDFIVPSPFLIQSYIDFCANNNLPSFIKLYIHLASKSAPITNLATDHIFTLLALNCAEELQMTRDILQYDLHYQKILFLPIDSKNGNYPEGMVVKARFLVKGMFESRPRVTIGDIIRLRPVEEDIFALCAADNLPRHMAEMQGIVTSCNARTEEVECQFLVTRHCLRDAQPATPNQYRVPIQQILFECNKIRYHMRFTFKREGFAFVSDALHFVLQDETLMDALTPDCGYDLKLHMNMEQDIDALVSKELSIEPEPYLTWNTEQLMAITAISSNLWKAVKQMSQIQAARKVQVNGVHKLYDKKRSRLPPYIIQGSPGTGKTSTLAEAVRRLKELHPTKRILACAPTEYSADALCHHLSKFFNNKQMLRLNWWQRAAETVQPPELLSYCLMDSRGIFDMPMSAALMSATKTKVLSYDIVVTTCVCAGALRHYSDLAGKLLFDVVIIDNVEQATEGETLVALSLCSPTGIMVMAGDAKMPGAHMRSPLYGLKECSQSIQERLLSLPLYSQTGNIVSSLSNDMAGLQINTRGLNQASFLSNMSNGKTTNDSPLGSPFISQVSTPKSYTSSSPRSLFSFDSKPGSFHLDSFGDPSAYETTTSLTVTFKKNYRSNYHMLQVPNTLFYGGELECCAEDIQVSKYLSWCMLPRHCVCPMLFVGVSGQHYLAQDSFSFYNLHEVNKVAEIVKSLMTDNNIQVDIKNIIVIAGFRSQVLKIREMLRSEGYGGVRVGGVEDFQEQEYDIAIISTVLTNGVSETADTDSLGLFGDDKQCNSAITRGKGLCVVLGHPTHLYSDKNWREYIEYCDQYGCCTGYPCPLLRKSIDSKDNEELINVSAQAALGIGFEDHGDIPLAAHGRDVYWRVNL